MKEKNDVVIRVVDLRKSYGDVKALDGISFEIYKGEIFALLGPNGAGKTTTMEILEGLRKPDSGEIYYFGEKVKVIGSEIKERMGVQLQDPAFFDQLTVKETLEIFRGLYKKGRDLNELINMMGLGEKIKSKVKNLSGGQLKRLAIAVALVNDPDIVFLDEPTTGLDPQARRAVWDIISQMRSEGKTIFLTTHYMEEAEKLADRVFIIDHGRIIAKGTVDELIGSLNMESVIVFELRENPIENSKELKSSGILKVGENRYEISTKNLEDDLSRLFDLSKSMGFDIENLTIRKPNLEDVFLKLTGRSLRD